MVDGSLFQVRLAGEDRRRLRALAERAGRTESDVVRTLLRSVNLDAVNTGIPSPTLRTGGSLAGESLPSREPSAA